MKTQFIALTLGLLISADILAQKLQHKEGPYVLNNSQPFKSAKKHEMMRPMIYDDYILQLNYRDLESIQAQRFTNDLQLNEEKTTDIEGKFHDRTNFDCFVKLKDKSYIFAREVFKSEEKEGLTALEFSPKTLSTVGDAKNIFKSEGKVATSSSASYDTYDLHVSNDKTKFMFTYSRVPLDRDDDVNKEIIGIYVFDQDLKKIWGGEYTMPHTEAKMDNLDFTLADNGKVYLLTKVFEQKISKTRKGDEPKPDFHFELLCYDGKSKVSNAKIDLDNNFPTEAYVYETPKKEIVIMGFYAKGPNADIDGVYSIKLDVEKGSFSKLNGGYFEIPEEVIKAYTSERERKKIAKKEKKDEDFNLGVTDLEIKKIYSTSDGCIKIIAEQYYVLTINYYDNATKTTRTRYETHANNVFVISISPAGKMEWVKKLPKRQVSGDAVGAQLSINSMLVGNTVHVFYVDNLKNFRLPEDEEPRVHSSGKGGFLTGVSISPSGEVTKYNLGEVEDFDTPILIRRFSQGSSNNLVFTGRRKKKNMVYSLQVN